MYNLSQRTSIRTMCQTPREEHKHAPLLSSTVEAEFAVYQMENRKVWSLLWGRTLLIKLLLVLTGAISVGLSINRFSSWGSPLQSWMDCSLGQPRDHSDDVMISKPSQILHCFEVHYPILAPVSVTDTETPTFNNNCTVLLMDHSFGFSYGMPYVGNYVPPSCIFNRVIMNFTVTSRGRQFDRLALMYFGDTEVWRTSTAEPTANGIVWTYHKDMSEYLYLWKQPQKLIFDLGNLVDERYTGLFNTTLTATFLTIPEATEPADLIIPISARRSVSNAASVFVLPSESAINVIQFPRNANRAVFTIAACGQAAEEFWWANVLQSNIDTFLPVTGKLYGWSPWREIQVYIDDQLAGVQWPFPVVFTGGVVPGLWRPIVGIQAFDIREHEIDITPWLPMLSDGKQHTFEIKVAGIEDDGKTLARLTETVGSSWYVTGKIFVWLDSPSSITRGTTPISKILPPSIQIFQSLTTNDTGANQTLLYSTNVSRNISISSLVRTEIGLTRSSWSQSLAYSNAGAYAKEGTVQITSFSSHGIDTSVGIKSFSSTYSFPLWSNSSLHVDASGSGNFSISASFAHGCLFEAHGERVFPAGLETFKNRDYTGTTLSTIQKGSAYYFSSPSTNTGLSFGHTRQKYSLLGQTIENSTETLYRRDVEAVNASIVRDRETVLGKVTLDHHQIYVDVELERYEGEGFIDSPREAIGRGQYWSG